VRLVDWIELQPVHPVLAAVVAIASARWHVLNPATKIRVTSGYRTPEAQAALYKAGKSRTPKSAHRSGLAVDLSICGADGEACVWSLEDYRKLTLVLQTAYRGIGPHEPGHTLFWGGDWVKLRDGVHWELQGWEPLTH